MTAICGVVRAFELDMSFKRSKGQKVPFRVHFDVEIVDPCSMDIQDHPERVREFDEKSLLPVRGCWGAYIKKLVMHISTKCVGHFENGEWKVEIPDNDLVAQWGFDFLQHDIRDRTSEVWRGLNSGCNKVEERY